MPLNAIQATAKIESTLPQRRITLLALYEHKYIFKAIDPADKDEGHFDPFFSVDEESGDVREFSIVTDITNHDDFRKALNEVSSL